MPDHGNHGKHGTVVDVLIDDAGRETGDPRDSHLYRVRLESGETLDVQSRDVRPPIQ